MTKRDKCLLCSVAALFLAAGAGEMYMDRAEAKAPTEPPKAIVEAMPVTVTLPDVEDYPESDEDVKITAALVEQGYLRDDVPLSYELQDTLHTACEEYGIPYHVALGLIETESGFRADADNGLCYGYCQLNRAYFPGNLTPAENIRVGVKTLAAQLARYGGDIGAALTAYNSGHDNGTRWYASRVLAAAEKWK